MCRQPGIELGTSRTEGCALTKCATLAPPFPPEDDSRTVRTVNMATLTVLRLGTSQYYVHVKLF